jgi:hypothetical protein
MVQLTIYLKKYTNIHVYYEEVQEWTRAPSNTWGAEKSELLKVAVIINNSRTEILCPIVLGC